MIDTNRIWHPTCVITITCVHGTKHITVLSIASTNIAYTVYVITCVVISDVPISPMCVCVCVCMRARVYVCVCVCMQGFIQKGGTLGSPQYQTNFYFDTACTTHKLNLI